MLRPDACEAKVPLDFNVHSTMLDIKVSEMLFDAPHKTQQTLFEVWPLLRNQSRVGTVEQGAPGVEPGTS